MVWKPNVTVASVLERDGRFLLVEERTRKGRRFNQPAGHLEDGESLAAAAARETLEETAHAFRPEALVGVYSWRYPETGITYLRFAFTGTVTGQDPARPLDKGILRAVWLSADEIRERRERHRSPLVMRCVEDYLAGRRYPLELITQYE